MRDASQIQGLNDARSAAPPPNGRDGLWGGHGHSAVAVPSDDRLAIGTAVSSPDTAVPLLPVMRPDGMGQVGQRVKATAEKTGTEVLNHTFYARGAAQWL